ncbi:MAG: hypothetical protein JNM43_10845 [Planctomycetaceae bacterium]|nr:hypothetical protein [Planctomycetaceae bacterium]
MNRIERAKSDAIDAKQAARDALCDTRELQTKVRNLEQQCERLNLALMALAEILRDKLGITEEQIEEKLEEIDLRDGQLDGKYRPVPEPSRCPACARPNAPNRKSCLYCGTQISVRSNLFPEPPA